LPAIMYVDADGDGYGIGNVIVYCSKDKPTGYSTNNEDCNDNDASVHQQTMYYVDADGDGFGGTTGQLFCLSSPPVGYSRYNSDCNDNDAGEQCCVFTNPMTFTAPANGNCYQLTSSNNQVGAVWGNDPINLNKDFDLNFNMTLSGPTSTGMMLVLQNTGTSAIGSTTNGGDMGYYNSSSFNQSIGVELDYANSGNAYYDLNDAHLTIVKNADPTPVSGTYDFTKSLDYEASYNVRIVWNHTTHLLTVYFNGTQALSYTKDLVNDIFGGNASVYVGFTSANEPNDDPKSKPAAQLFCVNGLTYDNPLIIYPGSSTLCNSGQLLTNAAGNCTFQWSTGATTPTIDINESGTYSVTITNAEGCVTTVSYNAVVNAGPVITASAIQLCPGSTITLTSSLSGSYLWSTGETTQSIVVNTAGEYNVSNGVCYAVQPIIITTIAASIEPGGSTNLCPGESVTLTASEGSSYLWSTGATTREIIVDATGTYSVNITYAEGCTLEASASVNVGALNKPNVFASNEGHPYNCNYPFVDLNQDTYPEYDQYTFTWYKVGVAEPLVIDNPNSNLQVDQPGQYYLVVKRNDCSSDASDSLNVIYDNGDPSVFGSNTWNVYVWQDGMASPQNPEGGLEYKGYYTEQELSFDTRNRWPQFLSPSFTTGFNGCPVLQDFFKWSAKRTGFAPGTYTIRIPAYDEEAKLWINGNLVWSDACCSNSGDNIVWTGHLDSDSKVEFSVIETMAFAFGAIQFEFTECSVPQPVITVNENTEICEGDEITLSTDAGFESYVWMKGENIIADATTNTLLVSESGSYRVKIINGNNCESEPSEALIVTVNPTNTYYKDADGDTYGDLNVTIKACAAPSGYVSDNTDCNDDDGTIYPGATEICDGKDNNCDGTIDEGFPSVTYYRDADGDGYGNAAITTTAKCAIPAGYVTNSTDCNDADATIHPGAAEICDGKDNNCNGTIDEGFPSTTYYRDADGDGYGNAAITTTAKCAIPAGYVTNNTDCNDADATIHPGAAEICDGKDNNCNGTIDEGFPSVTYYRDADGDGYGNAAITTTAKCAIPAGYVANNTDCNDADALVQSPIKYYIDADKDGYGLGSGKTVTVCSSTAPAGYSRNNTDCNDKNAAINPGAIEICDGIDNNCNGQVDEGCSLPNMSINDVSMAEGNTGKKTMSFEVVLSQTSTKAITVNYASYNGTATAGTDYTAKSGTLTFKPNTLKQTIDITILTDKIAEPNETFNITLTGITNAQLVKSIGVGTILNDDGGNMMTNKAATLENMDIGVQTVMIAPNPATNIVNLQLYGYNGKASIQLFTLEGKMLQKQNIQIHQRGFGQLKLNVSGYISGTYLLTITDDKGTMQTKKLIIVK
ncbi:MAG: MopE-related protein, partial [Bacteroidota bacterium]